MNGEAWSVLEEELARWGAAGIIARFWLRDDDAVSGGYRLARLLEAGVRHRVPIALAVIPAGVEGTLVEAIAGHDVTVLQHGVRHANAAPPGTKQSEFPEGCDASRAAARVAAGWRRLCGWALPVYPIFVPPWNRVDRRLAEVLLCDGYRAISAFGRLGEGDARWVNTHVDLIDWRGGRNFVGVDRALSVLVHELEAGRAVLGAAASNGSPSPLRRKRGVQHGGVGILSHHLVHDRDTWGFLEQLMARVSTSDAAEWVDVRALLGGQPLPGWSEYRAESGGPGGQP